MSNTKLTAAQQKSLDSLRAQQAAGWPNRSKYGHIATGLNTNTLHNLRRAGLIKVYGIYLAGIVTTDIEVVG